MDGRGPISKVCARILMGHYCYLCGQRRPNEQFSGRGHRDHVCKKCQRMPGDKCDRIERMEELNGFVHQSNISARNLVRLEMLSKHPDPKVATLAVLILDIGRVLPGKRNRWLK